MYSLHLPQLKNKQTNLISFEDPHKHENPPAWMPLPPHQISCLPAWPCIGISWLSPQGQIQVRICRFLKSHFTLGLGNQCQVEQQGWSVPFSSQLPCSPLLSPMTKDLNMRWELKRRITNDQILQQSVTNTFGFDVIALEEEKRFDKN